MWKCPVCDQENSTAAMVCPNCGYDQSCDYEQYPTAFAVTTAVPPGTLRRQWQEKQGPGLPERIAEWFRKAARLGYAPAQSQLEELEPLMPDQLFARYQREPDQAKRMEYLKKSAEMGYTPAQAELGGCYAQGRGVKQDYVKASEWYRRAAGQPPQRTEASQQAEPPQKLFELYRQESDQTKRMEYLKKSAEMGYAKAQAQMALTYSQGYGVEKNAAEATRWFQKLAQQNSPEAWYRLGRCYYYGCGVWKDKAQAVQWYRKAAEQGYAPAQYELGYRYYYGWGVKEDKAQAAQWYRKAAEQGDKDAQLALADCYANGRGVPKDPAQAQYWREKAYNT